MVCRCTRTLRPGRCIDSTHRFSHLTLLPPLFRSVPALSSPVTFLRRLVCRGFLFFLSPFFRCLVSAPSRCAVLYLRFAACAFPGVQAGMTGSDSDEARQVSQADLATFRQDVANEMAQQMAQLQACLLYTSPSPRDKRQSRMPSSA